MFSDLIVASVTCTTSKIKVENAVFQKSRCRACKGVEFLGEAMSEFKFACPVCGQHITADSHSTASQIECPTCFRKIVVPQAPASADSKFVLSASEVNKPRPQQTLPALEPVSKELSGTRVPAWLIVILILLLLMGGAALVVFRGKLFGSKPANLTGVSHSGPSNQDGSAADAQIPPAPVITNNIAWNLDLGRVSFPDTPIAGKIRGEFVSCNRNTLTGGALSFRQGMRGAPDLGVTIHFFSKQPEELNAKIIKVTTNDSPVPKILVRWKEGKATKEQSFTNGYALKLELGEIVGNRMPGKVYLCLPDENQTRIAGVFSAEIKKPAPPKPKQP